MKIYIWKKFTENIIKNKVWFKISDLFGNILMSSPGYLFRLQFVVHLMINVFNFREAFCTKTKHIEIKTCRG